MNNERQAEEAIRRFEQMHARKATPEEEARIKWLWAGVPQLKPGKGNGGYGARGLTSEKMHEELIAGGWNHENPEKPLSVESFYGSPTGKIKAFQYQAWRMMKDGNKHLGKDV